MKALLTIVISCATVIVLTGVMCGITHSTNATKNTIQDKIPYEKLPDSKDFRDHNERLTKWSYVFNILLCIVLCIHTALFCVHLSWVKEYIATV